jgi:hypothetical protein
MLVCLRNIKQYFLTGIGIGQFAYYYPLWQINYFSSNNLVPTQYFLNAAESHIAFNDIMQFFVEAGIIGISTALGFLIYLFKVKSQDPLSSVLKTTVILIMIASLTSYPLHCNVILFILTYCTASLVTLNEKIKLVRIQAKMITLVPLQLLIAFCVFNSFKQATYISKWKILRNDFFKDSVQIEMGYTNLLPKLQGNGKFLLDMGEHFADLGNTSKAIILLEKSKQIYISYRTFNSTAIAYYQLNDVNGAIRNLDMASNLIPSKFTTKFELLNLYQQCHDTLKTKQIAEAILTMPVKQTSPQVNDIKKRGVESTFTN